MSRASDNPPVPPGATRTVRVVADAHESDWAERLEKHARSEAHAVRQRLAIELANIHLRVRAGHRVRHRPRRPAGGARPRGARAVAAGGRRVRRRGRPPRRRGGQPGLRRSPGRGCTAPDRGRRAPGLRRRPGRARPRQGAAGRPARPGVAAVAGPGAVAALAAYPVGAGPHRPARRSAWACPAAATCQWRGAATSDTSKAAEANKARRGPAGDPRRRAGAAPGDLAPASRPSSGPLSGRRSPRRSITESCSPDRRGA